MVEKQPILDLDLGIGILKEDPMNYGEMADDAGVVLSSMRIQRACARPVEDSSSERQKSMNDDMPWAAILGRSITYFFSVHSDNIHHAQNGVASAAGDKISVNQQCSRLGMPHRRAAWTALQRPTGDL
jgi:hypothetical protein